MKISLQTAIWLPRLFEATATFSKKKSIFVNIIMHHTLITRLLTSQADIFSYYKPEVTKYSQISATGRQIQEITEIQCRGVIIIMRLYELMKSACAAE